MPVTNSPLRYPGGKTKLSSYVTDLLIKNDLLDGHYIEPYAGGAGLAISLLLHGYARYIHLNDLDRSIYAFWYCVLNETENLCRYIKDVHVNLDEWKKQRNIQEEKKESDLLSLGVSTLFLNRTNRSGILSGGVIGGKLQDGKYKIDARFNKEGLINKIKSIAFYRSRIKIYNKDAIEFIQKDVAILPENSIINLDPPYYIKGKALYENSYTHKDHEQISEKISTLKQYWFVTYDNVGPIKELYSRFAILEFSLSYSAQKRYFGKEILIADPRLKLPAYEKLCSIQ
jgi:DNA adenine methylase